MKLNGSWQRALIGFLVFLMAMPAPIFAQNNIPVFRQEELDQILAPIALYPDSLLAQILMAATYPLEVVQADRWVKQNRNLPPEALNDALDRQNWDLSVKALVPFPDVLSMMSERLDWTQMVGDAFLAQEADVMDTIQQLRAKAYAAGNLRSTQQLAVTQQGALIVIEPANPQVVYVPVYNPVVVYGRWWYPAYPPVVIYPYPPGAVIAAGIIAFGAGIAVASAWNHGWGHWDWGHRNVYVNVNRTVNINRTTTVINTRDIRTTTWQHSPEHRKGVAYRDPGTREKYAPTNRQAVETRRDYRGRDQSQPVRPTTVTRPAPETKPGPATVARPSTQARPESTVSRPGPDTRTGSTVARPAPEAKPAPGLARPAPETKPGPSTVARPSTQARPAQTISRPAPANTIYGVDQGSKARKESARGRDSLSSPRGQGDGPAKPSPGVTKPAPVKKPAPAQGGVKQEGGSPGRK
ncbi:MAG TPA: DUF3300 domain-containing protein [Syntrophales bacterium]|nr:DUF3300 domain-containing protein [Syntrophales bacterium]